MSRLDDLPPDQRAALSLLLSQRKRYAEVAALLQIGERAVHDRAHAALAVLAPREARELTPERREEIGDYLLGQRPAPDEDLLTREELEGSPAAQAWARAVAAELAPLASAPLPALPDGAGPAGEEAAVARAADTPAREPGNAGRASAGAPSLPAARAPAPLPSSRRGGAALLAGLAAVVAIVVLIATGALFGGSSHSPASSRSPSSSSSSSGAAGASPGSRASETRRLTLTAPNASSKALGVAAVLKEGGTYAYYLAAEHLAPTNGFFYAVWLYNSPSSFEALNRAPAVKADGRMQGGQLLPANAARYHQMIVTRETNERASHLGPIVLRGAFGLR